MKTLIVALSLFLSGICSAALSESQCATLVVNEIKTLNPLSASGEAQAKTYWEAICKGLLNHIKASADINLQAGDIPVPSVGLFDSLAQPVTGQAQSAPTGPLTGRIE